MGFLKISMGSDLNDSIQKDEQIKKIFGDNGS